MVTIPFVKGSKGPLFSVNSKSLNGFNAQVIYACAYETGITGKSQKPHVHDFDEAIFFIGTDPYGFDELGAEVEMSIGANEEEKYVFDKPTVFVIPKGVPHCPMRTRKIDKPYVCFVVSLTDEMR
ncbi:hypothetical protein ACFLUL_01955 [Chloroflexota bacterium]